MLNFSILSANLQPPVPPPEKPTGGGTCNTRNRRPSARRSWEWYTKICTQAKCHVTQWYSSNHISNSIRYPVVVSACKWHWRIVINSFSDAWDIRQQWRSSHKYYRWPMGVSRIVLKWCLAWWSHSVEDMLVSPNFPSVIRARTTFLPSQLLTHQLDLWHKLLLHLMFLKDK